MILWIGLGIVAGWFVILWIFEILVRIERFLGSWKIGVRVNGNAILKYDSAPERPKTKKELVVAANEEFKEVVDAIDAVEGFDDAIKDVIREEKTERHAYRINEILG